MKLSTFLRTRDLARSILDLADLLLAALPALCRLLALALCERVGGMDAVVLGNDLAIFGKDIVVGHGVALAIWG